MNRIQKIRTTISALLLIGVAVCGMTSCDESMERLLQEDYSGGGAEVHTGHVLCIIIDGASGKAVNAAYTGLQAPVIRSMRDYGVITFEGLADSRHDNLPVFTNERGWANLMTGVTGHGIGIEKETGGELKSIEELTVPSFLQRIKQVDEGKKISLYGTDNRFCEAFGSDADITRLVASDSDVKEAVITEIGSETDMPSDVVMVQFSGVQQAGETNGFYDVMGEPTTAIISAIQDIDGYIGEIQAVLKARENYRKENWLIVVTSTYGGEYPFGIEADTYYDDPRLNTFTLFYNYQLQSKVMSRPGAGDLSYKYFCPVFSGGKKYESAYLTDPSLFDMDVINGDKSYSIQFMYQSKETGNRELSILSKSNRNGSSTGWQIRCRYQRFIFIWPRTTEYTREDAADIIGDMKWHTITVVFDKEEDKLKIYTDGVLNMHPNHMTPRLYDVTCPDYPLTIGKIEGSNTSESANFSLSNLQIYDVALPEEFIAQNHGVTKLEEVKNEYWDNLLAYWPCDREEDMELPVLKDYSQYAHGSTDMVLEGKSTWSMGNSAEEFLTPTPDETYYQQVINNVDISFQIFQWLGLSTTGFDFEGVGKTLDYTFMEDN